MQYAEALASEMEHIHTAILIYSSLYYDSKYKIKKGWDETLRIFSGKNCCGMRF